MGDHGTVCPVFRPTREEFEQPFCDYVRKIFKKQPDLPMFKVVPPRGWRPRRTPFPDLRKVQINVPIRQHVFGTKGAYRCLFVEQKPMTVADFKLAAEEDAMRLRGGGSTHGTGGGDGSAGSGLRISSRTTSARYNRPPDYESSPATHQKVFAGADGECAPDGASTGGPDLDAVDPDLERAFWSNVTLNPPMYGADTPTSFFDDKLPYGWNLQHLGDLLQNHPKVDSVPGVTTPMTYFGMWRSFFGWHKEDADLYSVNFLHWGAPKVWYGVAPSAKLKFERMAQSLFPELHRACPAFVRHKDIMLSPACLKTYGVPCMRACQRPNEFIVLNAAAYHAGFNSGFNCAEAVNFGMKEWIPVGKEAVPCRCSALKDGVRISMKLFDPKWVDPYETPSESSQEEEDKDSEEGSEEEEEEDEEEEEEEDQQKTVAAKRRRGGARQASVPAAKKPRGRKPAAASGKKKKNTRGKKVVEESSEGEESSSSEEEDEVEEVPQSTKPKRKRMPTKKAAAAAAEKAEATAAVRKGSRAPAEGEAMTTSVRGKRSAATAVVKRAIAKSRGTADAVKSKASAPAAKPAAAAAKRGPGRPRKAVDTPEGANAAATPTAAAVSTGGRGSRKRKAVEEPEKAPAEAALAEGRGGRTRRAAAAAAITAAATVGIRKRARGGAAETIAEKDDAGASGDAAGGSEAVAVCARAVAGRRAKASVGQTEESEAAEAKDSGHSRGGRNSGRGAAASTPTATAAGTVMITAAATEEPPPAAPAPAAPVEVAIAEVNVEGRLVVTAVKPRSTVEAAAVALKARINTPCQESVSGPPMAIVGDADTPAGRRSTPAATSVASSVDKRFFFLVQRLSRPASTPGNVLLRWLKEGRDGLFRPVAGSVWEESAGALLPVRAQAVGPCGGATAADSDSDGDASGSGADVTGSSSPSHSAAGGPAAETVCEPEAWRLVTPRDQIINVELRRE
ncbi:hypothetical protein VaNZ11_008308 [Volvox africanus]|uniref:Jumonji domain-containing protein n=1 Tax=Volvox africanus TaxID=51714 RepID=A0ABQ5S4W5_9CHLO|nr:hypothetical protein VaNZ11_008308 [Volvox africanus]